MGLGNDLIDLHEPEIAGKSQDRRFCARVLSPGENVSLTENPDPDRWLWTLWAVKEAAYKASVQSRPDLTFRPRDYEVMAEGGGKGPIGSFFWRRETGPGWLHCLAWTPEEDPGRQVSQVADAAAWGGPETDFSAQERASFSGPASAAVRRLARHLLAAQGWPGLQILRAPLGTDRFGPPRAWSDQGPAPWSLSFSHHGRWIAAVLNPESRPPAFQKDKN